MLLLLLSSPTFFQCLFEIDIFNGVVVSMYKILKSSWQYACDFTSIEMMDFVCVPLNHIQLALSSHEHFYYFMSTNKYLQTNFPDGCFRCKCMPYVRFTGHCEILHCYGSDFRAKAGLLHECSSYKTRSAHCNIAGNLHLKFLLIGINTQESHSERP